MQIRPYREASFTTPPARTGRGRGRLLIVLAITMLAIAAAGYSAWWWMASGTLRDRTSAWIDARRAEGWRLDHAGLGRSGFPLEVAVRVDEPRVTIPSGALTWAADRLRVSVPVGSGAQAVIATRGPQAIELTVGGVRRRYEGAVERAAFSPAPGGWLPTGRLAIDRLALAEAGEEGVALDRLEVEAEGDPAAKATIDTETFAVRLRGTGLRRGTAEGAPAGEAAQVESLVQLKGTLRPQPWPAALARWRDDGGTIEVPKLRLTLGAIAVDGDGTLALDPDGQPQAAMSLRVRGYGEALDRLAEAGAFPAYTAAAAKILLRAAARTGEDGPDTLTAPLTLQDRTLSVGRVPLLTVPRADWLPERRPTR